MTNKYYLRSISPDGTGEVVQPTMEEPANSGFYGSAVYLLDFSSHLRLLPQVATATKELVAVNGLGWVKECRVGYEVEDVFGKGAMPGWYRVTQIEYERSKSEGMSTRILLDVPDAAEKEMGSVFMPSSEFPPEDFHTTEFAAETYAMGEFNHQHDCEKHMIAYKGYFEGAKSARKDIAMTIYDQAKANARFESGTDRTGFIYMTQLKQLLDECCGDDVGRGSVVTGGEERMCPTCGKKMTLQWICDDDHIR